MTAKKQEICNLLETLPEELSGKVIDYIEYLKFASAMNDAPENLKIKSKKDLREKLEEGIKASEDGEVYSIDETFNELEKNI